MTDGRHPEEGELSVKFFSLTEVDEDKEGEEENKMLFAILLAR